jgi:nucleoid DNA-binding protein
VTRALVLTLALTLGLFSSLASLSSAQALTREEMVTAVALDAGISEAQARRAVASVLDRIVESVSNGEPAIIERFGTFRTQQGRSMKTPIFLPASDFRNAVK